LGLCYSNEKENLVETEQDGNKKEEENNKEVGSTTNDGRCERTFITFLDEQVFRNVFPQTQPKLPARNICPITRYFYFSCHHHFEARVPKERENVILENVFH
jgi:hypothetical protein